MLTLLRSGRRAAFARQLPRLGRATAFCGWPLRLRRPLLTVLGLGLLRLRLLLTALLLLRWSPSLVLSLLLVGWLQRLRLTTSSLGLTGGRRGLGAALRGAWRLVAEPSAFAGSQWLSLLYTIGSADAVRCRLHRNVWPEMTAL